MAILTVNVETRDESGSHAARKLRASGFTPGNLYAHGEPAAGIKLDAHRFSKYFTESLNLVTLEFPDGHTQVAAVREIQRDPMTQELLHIDFIRVRMDESTEFHIPVIYEGTPEGVRDGGVLTIASEMVKVECLPTNIPESIKIDVSMMKIGESKHAGDLVLPENVKLISEPVMVLVSITSIRVTEVVAAPAEGEVVAGAEGEGTATAEGDKAGDAGKKAGDAGKKAGDAGKKGGDTGKKGGDSGKKG